MFFEAHRPVSSGLSPDRMTSPAKSLPSQVRNRASISSRCASSSCRHCGLVGCTSRTPSDRRSRRVARSMAVPTDARQANASLPDDIGCRASTLRRTVGRIPPSGWKLPTSRVYQEQKARSSFSPRGPRFRVSHSTRSWQAVEQSNGLEPLDYRSWLPDPSTSSGSPRAESRGERSRRERAKRVEGLFPVSRLRSPPASYGEASPNPESRIPNPESFCMMAG
jgi:hypothetical protein